MLPTSAGVEPATSWSPVGRRIQLSHRGRLLRFCKSNMSQSILESPLDFVITSVDCIYWAVTSENVLSDICAQRRFRSACASTQSGQYLQWFILDSKGYKVYSCRQWWLWSGFMDPHLIWVFIGRTCQRGRSITLRLSVSIFCLIYITIYLRVMCGQQRPRSGCADEPSDQDLRCPQTESLDTIECFNAKQMPGWDFAHVHDDVNPHILRMLEGTFSLNAAHLRIVVFPGYFISVLTMWKAGKYIRQSLCV